MSDGTDRTPPTRHDPTGLSHPLPVTADESVPSHDAAGTLVAVRWWAQRLERAAQWHRRVAERARTAGYAVGDAYHRGTALGFTAAADEMLNLVDRIEHTRGSE